MATAYAQPTEFEQAAMQAAMPLEDQLQMIADRLQKLATDAVQKRSKVEERWLKALRAFHGRYDADTEQALADAEKSRAYVKITRKKTNSWDARLGGLLFPTDEENWDISSTPVPTMSDDAKQAMQQAMQQVQAANQQMAQQNPQAAQQMAQQAQQQVDQAGSIAGMIEEAKHRAEAMAKEMKDQLIECDYGSECRMVIRDACRLGTGILKGPMAGERQRGSWLQLEGGEFQYNRESDPAPIIKWTDPWNYFPDPSALRPEDREFDLERHLWSKKDLRRLVREKGFNADAVRRLLQEDRSMRPVTDTSMSYLVNLRAINGSTEAITGRYVGWEYHGPLECEEVVTILRATGRAQEADQYEQENDPLKEVRVIVFFCEDEILKIAPCYPLDSNESLYSLFIFEPSEASIFGYGIPDIMADSQAALNGAWRMALDNAGLSVGPQIFIDRDIIEPANRRWKLEPRKIWYKKKGAGVQGTAMEAVHITNNVEEIMNIVEVARKFIDDETALPVQAEGELTDNPNITATATNFMSMASNVTFRRVVKAFDDGITVPTLRRLYDWNMQHNSRTDIKGDMKVEARGSSALLLREMQSAMLLNVAQAWTVHQTLSHMIDPYAVARETVKSMMIDPDQIMVSKEQADQSMQAAQQAAQQAQQQNPAVIAANARLEATKIDSKARIDVAELQRETELMKLAEMTNMNLDKLRAMLQGEQMKIDSKERMMAGEAAVEMRLQEHAHEHDQKMKGSGGFISAS